MSDHQELDPLIMELFNKLPEPGVTWPEESRRMWLLAAEGAFGLIYKEN